MLQRLRTQIRRATDRHLGLAFDPIVLEMTYEDVLADLTYPQDSTTTT